jgi:hypothetical protein
VRRSAVAYATAGNDKLPVSLVDQTVVTSKKSQGPTTPNLAAIFIWNYINAKAESKHNATNLQPQNSHSNRL